MHSKNYTDLLINESASLSLENFIERSEDNYHNQINLIVEEMKDAKNLKFLMISGPSSAGKTTSSNLIMAGFKAAGRKCYAISLDDFFVDREKTPLLPNGEKDYEGINSIEWSLFSKCMDSLVSGKATLMPTYNFLDGVKEFHNTKTLEENELIIIEGLHALNPIIENFLDKKHMAKLYLSVTSMIVTNDIEPIFKSKDVRLLRRMIRDVENRGNSPEKTLNTWKAVCDGETAFITPFKHQADYKIDTIHPYEICVYADIILGHFNLDTLDHPLAKEIHEKLLRFKRVESSNVPKTSLIQEFIK